MGKIISDYLKVICLASLFLGHFARVANSGEQTKVGSRTSRTVERRVLNSSIRISAREDRLEALKEHLKSDGAEINSQSGDGTTALMYAARNCYPKVVRFLLENGANVNLQDKKGRTALMHAARALCLPVVKSLLKIPGLELELVDHFNRTALDYARSATSLEVGGSSIRMLNLLENRKRTNHSRDARSGYTGEEVK